MSFEQDDLPVLACDIGARPRGAPSIFDVAAAVRGVQRDEASVTVAFDPAYVDTVAAFVAAERQCCPTLDWRLEHGRTLMLRVGAAPDQLDVLERIFQDL